MQPDAALDCLLSMNGLIHRDQDGTYVKIEAKLVKSSPARPHGIKYSLTLHAEDGCRLFAIDNAHAIKKSEARHAVTLMEYDHRHPDGGPKVRPYEFVDVGTLLEDFWAAVERIKGDTKS
jgi:hypothetical protein